MTGNGLNIFLKAAVAAFTASALGGCAAVPAKGIIATREAPAAIGPYSQAVRYGGTLFLAGQIALEPGTGRLRAGAIEEQTKQVMENLRAVLAANGMTMADLVSTTVFLADMNDFAKMNAVYGAYFTDKPPARATAQVSALPRGALVEISAVAAK